MNLRLRVLPAALIGLSLSLSFQANAAQQTIKREQIKYSAALNVEYGTGDYVTSTTTDSVTTKLVLGWYPTDRLDFSLEIPYLYQSNGVTTPFGMGRFKTARMQQSGSGQGPRPVRVGPSSFASSFDVTRSQSGIGDLILKGGFIVMQEKDLLPEVRPEVYVKFPAADEKKGLGTGEYDGGLGVMLSKSINDWNGYFEGVYNFIGKSPDFQLKDYFSYELGVGYQVTDRFLPIIAVRGATTPAEDSTSPFELRIKALYSITGRTAIVCYLSKGFTDGTADYGAGAQISLDF
jgi:hypothetical protein